MLQPPPCPPLWTQDPSILLRDAADFYPFGTQARRCVSTALNSLVRFGLYLGIALALVTHRGAYLGIPIALAALAAAMGASHAKAARHPFAPTQAEGFRGDAAFGAAPVCSPQQGVDVIGGVVTTVSSVLQELQASAVRAPPPTPDDVFERQQRQFVSPPARGDREGYEAWLFAGDAEGATSREALLPPTCRQGGGEQCRAGAPRL